MLKRPLSQMLCDLHTDCAFMCPNHGESLFRANTRGRSVEDVTMALEGCELRIPKGLELNHVHRADAARQVGFPWIEFKYI